MPNTTVQEGTSVTSHPRTGAHRALRYCAALAAAAGLLAGCSSSEEDGSTPAAPAVVDQAARALLPKAIADAGTVKIGLGAQFPPFSYHPESGKGYAGYEPDLMDAIMDRLGLKPEYIDVKSVGEAVPTIQSGRISVAALGITDNAERQEHVIFVDNLIGRNGAVFPAAAEGKYKQFTDMCGLKVAAVIGSVSVTIVETENAECTTLGKPPMTLVQFKDNAATLLAVRSGRADAAMQTYPGAGYQVKQNPGAFWALPINDGMNARFPNGIAVDRRQPELAKAIAAALQGLVADGTYAKILTDNDVDPELNGITEVHTDWATNGFS
ncbi:transporter substrate-binding domain-containing protein [Gordonia amarae]|uniref:Transporter substrate-binding domain-containing protein n=1 Tax=Gordonia amarae TaxID=36821 RepID=A0A857KYD9_9ACTN|nr:transporter substrate-binding domain-containing protein [Gordonia amarae]QHN22272.1 transporter substrate-binding domain-containing protein [Gordonia amarae]QHN31148.1 transporter substrate-binding domain-containing protein [Gordonia amarae]QHN39894.1 transporter substrate-binding domain-containing protein [Gordonia amarae]